MYRIELRPGEETALRTIDELTVGIRNGVITSRARIWHSAGQKWLPIDLHPHYRAALEQAEGLSPTSAPLPVQATLAGAAAPAPAALAAPPAIAHAAEVPVPMPMPTSVSMPTPMPVPTPVPMPTPMPATTAPPLAATAIQEQGTPSTGETPGSRRLVAGLLVAGAVGTAGIAGWQMLPSAALLNQVAVTVDTLATKTSPARLIAAAQPEPKQPTDVPTGTAAVVVPATPSSAETERPIVGGVVRGPDAIERPAPTPALLATTSDDDSIPPAPTPIPLDAMLANIAPDSGANHAPPKTVKSGESSGDGSTHP